MARVQEGKSSLSSDTYWFRESLSPPRCIIMTMKAGHTPLAGIDGSRGGATVDTGGSIPDTAVSVATPVKGKT